MAYEFTRDNISNITSGAPRFHSDQGKSLTSAVITRFHL